MPERAPRVVYVITTSGMGGAERQVYDLATSFRARGWDVSVVSIMQIGKHFQPLRDLGVRLESLEMTPGVYDPRAVPRLARLLRLWRPDVVHAHMVHANLLARLCRPLAPVPKLISTMHNQDEGAQWRYYAYRLTDRLTDLTTTVSQLAVEEAVRRHAVPADRIRLIPNGIHSEQFERDPVIRESTRTSLGLDDAFTWLAVGRLNDAKRHMDMLEAVRLVREEAPGVRLLVAGDGRLRAAVEHQIARTDLHSNVSLLGHRDDVRALMQAADGFVMSSAWEGLPIVLLEASASSLPIVATDVGGSREVIEEAETGYLTPALRPELLAEAMLRVMESSPVERHAMGEKASQRVRERFDMERVADDWEALYEGS